MPYRGRPVLEVLPEFVGAASTRQTPEERARLISFCAEHYVAGRSIRELAELTGRTQTAVRALWTRLAWNAGAAARSH